MRLGPKAWFAAAILIFVAWFLGGAWALPAGFAVGLFHKRLVHAAVIGAIISVALSFFSAAQSCATSGLLSFLVCPLAYVAAFTLIPLFAIAGVIEAAIGYYIGRWAAGPSGGRRGISGSSMGALFLFLALVATIFFASLTGLSSVPTTSGVSPIVVVLVLVGIGLYFVVFRGRRR